MARAAVAFPISLALVALGCGHTVKTTTGVGGALSTTSSTGITSVTVGATTGNTSASSTSAATVTTSSDSSSAATGTGGGPACGVRTGHRGLTTRSIMVGSANRTYAVYLPSTLDPTKPLPLVFVFHGYTMSGMAMHDITGYDTLADSEGFGVVFPDGEAGPNSLGAPWNVGMNVCPSWFGTPPEATGDDFGFLDAMRTDVAQDQCVDAAHVFVTGFSMGGYFAHQVGCLRSDIRGVAPHSGGTHDLVGCTAGHKPIIIFHGDSDAVIPNGCADPKGTIPAGGMPSALEWAARNGCAMTATSTPVMNGTCETFDGCPADGQVELCTFNGMGHCWAGGAANTGSFSCPNYASATQLEWAFWKQYAW